MEKHFKLTFLTLLIAIVIISLLATFNYYKDNDNICTNNLLYGPLWKKYCEKPRVDEQGHIYKIEEGRYVYMKCSLDDVPLIAYYFQNSDKYHSTIKPRTYNKELCEKEGGSFEWAYDELPPIITL